MQIELPLEVVDRCSCRRRELTVGDQTLRKLTQRALLQLGLHFGVDHLHGETLTVEPVGAVPLKDEIAVERYRIEGIEQLLGPSAQLAID